MELSLFFLVLTVLWKTSSCVQCFKCFSEYTYEYYEDSKLLCQNFDGSDKYIENCTKSTMCYKRVTTYNIRNKIFSVSVRRGCASQSLGQEPIKKNGKWHQETIVHDNIYEETCEEDHSDERKLTTTLKCHCRGDYCNGSIHNVIHFKTVLLILLLYVFVFS